MKARIVYGAIFGTAFIVVTVIIIFLNSVYTNIFHFDFTQPQPLQSINTNAKVLTISDIDNLYGKKIKKDLVDSIKAYQIKPAGYDSNFVLAMLDSTINDSLAVFRKKILELEKRNNAFAEKKQTEKIDTVKSKVDTKKIEEWAKQTAKLYEVMDPKKAAKIIQNYSDNESREILFKMNKKKAAKILAELNPEFAQRITKAL